MQPDNSHKVELTDSLDGVKSFHQRKIRPFLEETPTTEMILKHRPQKSKAPRSSKNQLRQLAGDIYEHGHLDKEIGAERLCPRRGADTKLLMVVTSAPGNAQARLTIRQTWGSYANRRDIGMAFILGRRENASIGQALSRENFLYGDLIRGNSIDSVNNLTLKTISLLEWVDLHCQKAKYVLKTDDDMFINVPRMLAFLETRQNQRRVIYGILAEGFKPIRNRFQKYYVPRHQFAENMCPPFTIGSGYVISGDIIHELFQRSLATFYLQLEDVFTTGLVASSLGVQRVRAKGFINKRHDYNACNVRNAITLHKIKPHEQFDLWQKLLNTDIKC
ncbi:beta-1,3-galactosyltransferase 1-like [Drosophila kikkawai]|uniref:Hexosyltransferase n=1 Tax=Drosophila kikkawai TaxID=30033 RepID=A0A6P4I941_DROKI|nr:beta-1,3-galactosyltransferase 1-like [Drosophila kikkawai]